MHNYRPGPFLLDTARQIARRVRNQDKPRIEPGNLTLEEALKYAKRPEFLPNLNKAIESGAKAKISYWLHRTLGL